MPIVKELPTDLRTAQIAIAWFAAFTTALFEANNYEFTEIAESIIIFDKAWRENEAEFLAAFGLSPEE